MASSEAPGDARRDSAWFEPRSGFKIAPKELEYYDTYQSR